MVEAPGIERRLSDLGLDQSRAASLGKSQGCEPRKATTMPVSVVGERSHCSTEVSELQRVLRALERGDIPLAKQALRSLIGRGTATTVLSWSLPVPKGPRRRRTPRS
jgi:hypothetical protein